MNKKIFVYAKANTMKGHRFTDDVAICLAKDIYEALDKFKRLYLKASIDDISECKFNEDGDVIILTDY